MRTDVDALPVPEWLREQVLASSRDQLLQQGFDVGRAWWHARLDSCGMSADLFADDKLSRRDLFLLGEESVTSPLAARRLLWASCAWGTGPSQRGNGRRIAGVARDPDKLGQLLADAAALARRDPSAGYSLLHPKGNAIAGLGPAFSTKYLYFAGGGAADHGCLILDARVARRLHRTCGWTSLNGITGWPAATYDRYIRLLGRWAAELSSDDRRVAPDEIELRLFVPPRDDGVG
ncbi:MULTISPECIES: 8-oxoguanine DNA glycosylase OGG fold protein [unclassified Modestobacter]